mgnify:CR=1 FL=1
MYITLKFEKYHGKIHSPVASDADCGLKMVDSCGLLKNVMCFNYRII